MRPAEENSLTGVDDWTGSVNATIVPPMARAATGMAGIPAVGKRVAYGALAIVVLVMLVEIDVLVATKAESLDGPLGDLLRRGNILPLFFLVFILRGAVELSRLLRAKAARPHVFFACLMIALLLLTPWLSAGGWLGKGSVETEGFYWQIVWLAVTGLGVSVLAVIRGAPDGTFRDMGATLIMVFYLGFLSSFGLQLRCGRDIPGQEGAWLLLIAVLVTKASDIGAYFVGSAFGRHKLAPTISPAKSVEGMFGGLIAGAATALLFASATSWITWLTAQADVLATIDVVTRSFSIEHVPAGMNPLIRAAVFGFFMSAAGQFGDLVESCFKRDAGIKDSGRVVPHYGGILDMIDSPVLAMPVAWFLLTVVWSVA